MEPLSATLTAAALAKGLPWAQRLAAAILAPILFHADDKLHAWAMQKIKEVEHERAQKARSARLVTRND